LYRTFGEFQKISLIVVIVAAAGLVLVTFVWAFGFWGLCLRVMGIWGLTLMLFWKWRPLPFRPKWSLPDLKVLAGTGLPIFGVGQLYAWWPVLNSTLVLKYAGTEGLGLFAIANLAGPTVAMLPQALGQVVYPQMAEEYGKGASIADLVRLVAKPTLVTFAFTSVVVVAGWFLTPPIVSWVLPKYVAGTSAAQWSVVGALALALTPVNNVFNVVKRQGLYGLAMVSGMVAYYVTLRLLVHDGIDLVAFPKAMIVGRVVFVVICYGLIWYLGGTSGSGGGGDH
jgi:O-antigen/teichoic acid export membrane protein